MLTDFTDSVFKRYVLAAEFVREARQIIEIGALYTPICNFLAKPLPDVHLISPDFTANYLAEDVKNDPGITLHFRTFAASRVRKEPYAVVILGLELRGFEDDDWTQLYGLLTNAENVVIEYALRYKRANRQAARILSNVEFDSCESIIFELRQNYDSGLEFIRRGFSLRKMLFLKGNGASKGGQSPTTPRNEWA